MSHLEEVILSAVRSLNEGRSTTLVSATDLHSRVRELDPALQSTVGDVEEVVRHMHQDGRGLRIQYAEGSILELRLLSDSRHQIGTQVNVNGGNVQVGDYNDMTFNENTFGSVLVEFRSEIERSNIPDQQKSTLLTWLDRLLAHPLLSTILTLTLGGK